ncbi:MAG TPA: BadF/BadG/BcrA/BcrD ATPase family protein [Burkholderiaceae bacterium]
MRPPAHPPSQYLGLDAGGSATRWALADGAGALLAEGAVGGLSGLQLAQPGGRAALAAVAQQLAGAVLAQGRPLTVCAGITGLAEVDSAALLAAILAPPLGLDAAAVHCISDIELACRAAFAPGEGHLLYAGTGSIAAHLDASGQLHRAGGRGGLLGDEGSGYWIAKEALAAVWRAEDARPGSWRQSKLAGALFERIGGSDWPTCRAFVYGDPAERGAFGQLALAVAACADTDPLARALMLRAGDELARLAKLLSARLGERPIVAAGRVLLLHPLIGEALRAALPARFTLELRQLESHRHAARLATQS